MSISLANTCTISSSTQGAQPTTRGRETPGRSMSLSSAHLASDSIGRGSHATRRRLSTVLAGAGDYAIAPSVRAATADPASRECRLDDLAPSRSAVLVLNPWSRSPHSRHKAENVMLAFSCGDSSSVESGGNQASIEVNGGVIVISDRSGREAIVPERNFEMDNVFRPKSPTLRSCRM